MTARHIDATDKTDGSHVVKILWNENDGERELTVRMPAAGTDATDRVDVDLLPVPGEDPATTMDDAVAALEGFLGNNKYIHIDGDDVRSVCAGALTTVIRVESGSSTGIVEALDGRFHDSSVVITPNDDPANDSPLQSQLSNILVSMYYFRSFYEY